MGQIVVGGVNQQATPICKPLGEGGVAANCTIAEPERSPTARPPGGSTPRANAKTSNTLQHGTARADFVSWQQWLLITLVRRDPHTRHMQPIAHPPPRTRAVQHTCACLASANGRLSLSKPPYPNEMNAINNNNSSDAPGLLAAPTDTMETCMSREQNATAICVN